MLIKDGGVPNNTQPRRTAATQAGDSHGGGVAQLSFLLGRDFSGLTVCRSQWGSVQFSENLSVSAHALWKEDLGSML